VVVGVPALLIAAYLLFRQPAPPVESGLVRASTPVSTSIPEPSTASGASTTTLPSVVTVHVAGRVVRSDVYALPSGSRVVDAVDAAGGPAMFADLDSVNLAALIVDGQQVYVPAFGEAPHAVVGSEPISAATTTAFVPVNLNTATEAQLDSLPGIGPATAKAIVTYRVENGPFASVQSLEAVPGIGAAKVAKLDGLVTV
jgi:competence protein ComEA